ncbi:MAG: PEP-CTERM sorting domain-containing protein [Bryobacterales bacterium]|nr:PEP-CTERM sorting domain-containing protein [Bryobacterales bacterium]
MPSVVFYFQNFSGITGWNQDITYTFHADNAGAVGSVLATGAGQNVVAVDSGLPWCCGGNAFQVTFDLQSAFNAAAGTTYWLELGGTTGGTSAFWVTANANGTHTAYSGANGVLGPTPDQMAFALLSSPTTVPEPGTLMLFGVGAIALGAIHSCQRRRRTSLR